MSYLQQIIESPFGIQFATTLGRFLPLRLGYFVSDRIVDMILSQPDSRLVRTVRLNQWMAHEQRLDPAELDQAVRNTFYQMARSIFEVYYYIHKPDAIHQLLVLDPMVQELIKRPAFGDSGLMLVGLHLSNFDLVMRLLCSHALQPLVITVPNLRGGLHLEYIMRKQIGINIIPASLSAVRQALQHLNRGGMVLTGIDRPISEPKLRPRFFGKPASLPTHHVFLAIKARVPIMVNAIFRRPDGKYQVTLSEPVEMDTQVYSDESALRNAERVLAVAENFIRQSPQQWAETLPVWPDAALAG